MFTSYAWAFKETWRGLCRDARMLALATVLAGFALSVPLFIFTVVYGISEPIRSLPTAVEISVFTTEKADVKALTEEIEALPDIESVRHIPKETAFRELNEGLGVKRSKMHNPLPDLLVATVSDRADPDEIEKTASAMEKLEGVDMIAYESEWHTKLTVLTDVVRTGLLFLGGTIFLRVSLVLWAALRMTTLSARAEMRALYLFGATPLFAIRPWAWRGTLVMLAGALLAILITASGIHLLAGPIAEAAAIYETPLRLALPPAPWCAYFVAFSAFAGGLIAAFSALGAWRSVH